VFEDAKVSRQSPIGVDEENCLCTYFRAFGSGSVRLGSRHFRTDGYRRSLEEPLFGDFTLEYLKREVNMPMTRALLFECRTSRTATTSKDRY
jgi:hypothetical protein